MNSMVPDPEAAIVPYIRWPTLHVLPWGPNAEPGVLMLVFHTICFPFDPKNVVLKLLKFIHICLSTLQTFVSCSPFRWKASDLPMLPASSIVIITMLVLGLFRSVRTFARSSPEDKIVLRSLPGKCLKILLCLHLFMTFCTVEWVLQTSVSILSLIILIKKLTKINKNYKQIIPKHLSSADITHWRKRVC